MAAITPPQNKQLFKDQIVQLAVINYTKILAKMQKRLEGEVHDLARGIFFSGPYIKALHRHGKLEFFNEMQLNGVFYNGFASTTHWRVEVDPDSPTGVKPFVFRILEGITPSEALRSLKDELTIIGPKELPLICYLLAFQTIFPSFDHVFRADGNTPLRIAAQPDDLGSLFRFLEFKGITDSSQVQIGGKLSVSNHPKYPVKFLNCDHEVVAVALKVRSNQFAAFGLSENGQFADLETYLLDTFNGEVPEGKILPPHILKERRHRLSFNQKQRESLSLAAEKLSMDQFKIEGGGRLGEVTYHLDVERLWEFHTSTAEKASQLVKSWQDEPLETFAARFQLLKLPGSNSPPTLRKVEPANSTTKT